MTGATEVGRRPRVLVCATGFPRSIDDPHKPFLLEHASALTRVGAEVTVLCPSARDLPSHEVIGGVEVVRFRYGPRRWESLAYDGAMYKRVATAAGAQVPPFLISFLASALTVARRRNVDIIHGHWWLPAGAVAVAAARATGARSVLHLHGSDAAMTRGPLRGLAKGVLGSADLVLAVSPELARWASPFAGREVEVVPMPIRLDGLEPSAAPRDGFLLGVGRLVPEKGFDLLVRSAAVLGERLVIVGEGPQRKALEALARSTGAEVCFVGQVAPGEIGTYYRQARIVVVPSRREGFGLVAAEAAAAGRAVVGSSVGGLPQLIDDGETGVLVEPGDLDSLLTGLRRVTPSMGVGGPGRVGHLRGDEHGRLLLARYGEMADAANDARGQPNR